MGEFMKRMLGIMIALLLALPACGAQEKGDKKPPSAKEQYDNMLLEFSTKQRLIIAEFSKLKGEEQQKLLQKYREMGKEYAEKFYKLAEDNPQEPMATDALFWVLQFGAGSAVHAKAMDTITELIAKMPLKDLAARVGSVGPSVPLLDAVFKRARQDIDEPGASTLLGWIGLRAGFLPVGQKAIKLLVEKFPDDPALERVCQALGQSGAPGAADTLKQIFTKTSRPRVKGMAAMGLGSALAAQADLLGDKLAEADKVAAEGEKYLVMVIEDYSKDSPALLKDAERELKALRTLRVGKTVPEIAAADLDEKEFKLSDYRGKVVLLDFWGNW